MRQVNLISRDSQLNYLDTILKRALQSHFEIVFIKGEAGAGKTVLVEEFTKQVANIYPEIIVATGKCHSITGGQHEPFLPFIQILNALVNEERIGTLGNRLRRILTDVAPDWISLIPVVGGATAAAMRTTQAVQREFKEQGTGIETKFRMVQYSNALRQMADKSPLLLWIDDLHWSDNATLDLIGFLADHASNARIMLIACYRPTDIGYQVDGQAHPVKQLVSKLKRYEQCSEIEVPNFTLAGVREFLRVSGHRLPSELASSLWRQSGGNPLFVREYVNLLHERRLFKRKHGAFVLSRRITETEIPPTVQEVIEQRLDIIGRDLRRVLSYASVQGERFASRILANLLETPELSVLEKLNLLEKVHRLIIELERRKLIVKVGTEYQFIHVLIQQVLYNDLSTGQRVQLHLNIAQLLEKLYEDHAHRYADDLATHFELGNDFARAVHYYLLASRNALDLLALDDAITKATAADRLSKEIDDTETATGWQIQALIYIAQGNYWKANHESVLEKCKEIEKLCQQGDYVVQYARMLYWKSRSLHMLGQYEKELETINEALGMLNDSKEAMRLRGNLLVSMSALRSITSRFDIAQQLDDAIEIANKLQFPDLKVGAVLEKAWQVLDLEGKPTEAKPLFQEVLRTSEEFNMLYEQSNAHRGIAQVFRRLKQGCESLHHSEQAVKVAKRSGSPILLHEALCRLAVSQWEIQQDAERALSTVREAVAIADQYSFSIGHDVINSWFLIAFGLGHWEEVELILRRFTGSTGASHPRGWGYYHLQRGHLSFAQDRWEEAVEAYTRATKIFNNTTERDFRRAQPFLGMALLENGNLQEGLEQLESAAAYWKDRDSSRYARCLRGLARVDMAQGRHTDAIVRLRKGVTLASSGYFQDGWPDAQHIRIDLGQALLEIGEVAGAMEQALSGYKDLKKWKHFLVGDAAFVVGQILIKQDKHQDAKRYLYEAQDEWQRLSLTRRLERWHAFMRDLEVSGNSQ
jgi:tetratricopeptide (TPR) repeat protein